MSTNHWIRPEPLIILCWLCALSFLTSAGQNKTDSLKQVIKDQELSRQMADNLIDLSVQYYLSNEPDSAMRYAEEAGKVATAIGYREGIAESHYKVYLADYLTNNYQRALTHLRTFINLSAELNDDARLGKGLYSYGTLLDILGMKDSALYYIEKSMVIHSELKDSVRLIANYNALGNIYMNVGEHDSSVVYLIKAAQLVELSGNRKDLGAIYNNLGKMFTRMMLYNKARHYLGLALDINMSNNNLLKVQSLSLLGSLFARTGEIDSAFFYYDREAEEIKPLGVVKELGDLNNNYAALYEYLNKPDIALEYFNKAHEIFNEIGYMEGNIMALKNLGRINSIKGNYSLAEVYLDSALNMSVKAGYNESRRLILEDLKDNYHRAGNDKKAFEYYDLYFALYDSMLNVDKLKALSELESKYQKQKDHAKILSLEKDNLQKTIQRNAFLYGAIGIFMLAAFTVLYFRQRARKDKIIAEQKIIQLEEEKKLMMAKMLIEGQEEERKRIATDLHDGLGVILSATKMQFTTIKGLSPENRPLFERATQLLEQASNDVRRISHNMMPGSLTKLGFYESVEDLLERINESGQVNATCTIIGDTTRLPENKEIMLYRVIQEMVNNTIKHARAENISVDMDISITELKIIYKDDGIGLDLEKVTESESPSLGMKSIQSRISFLNGQIKIETAPGKGLRYEITVPVG